MIDYWSKLQINECWSEKQRYNYIMNFLLSPKGTAPQLIVEEEEEEIGAIHITVTNNNVGVGNIIVTVTDGTQEYTGKTGGEGGCNITEIPYGEYTISIDDEGYVPYEDTIFVDSESIDVAIELTAETGISFGQDEGD